MGMASDRIAFLGVFGSGNFGNDASFAAMLQAVRRTRPGATLSCICPDPDNVTRDHGLPAYKLSWSGVPTAWFRLINRLLLKIPSRLVNLVRAFLYIRHVDVLIVPGTGIFDDFGEGPWGVPFGVFRWCLAAWLSGTRIAIVSVGAGPIHHPISRWFMKAALGMATYRSYRDVYSRDYLIGIGFDASADPLYPDLTFGLETPAPRRARAGEAMTVGVGLMAYYNWRNDISGGTGPFQAYLDKMERFIVGLLDKGHHVRLLIGDRNDLAALDALRPRLAAARPALTSRLAAPPIASLADVMRIVADCDVVIATRFHNLVGAVALGRPVISIGYAQKNDQLLEAVGLGDFRQQIASLDVGVLEAQFTRLAEGRADYAARIAERVALWRVLLGEQEDALIAMLFPAAPLGADSPPDLGPQDLGPQDLGPPDLGRPAE